VVVAGLLQALSARASVSAMVSRPRQARLVWFDTLTMTSAHHDEMGSP
jgi:hypothetical protein